MVGIFPSGTRTAEDAPLKRGAVTIANLASVPLVPAIYSGPTSIKELLSKKPILIRIGEPMHIERTSKSKHDLKAASKALSEAFKLLEEKGDSK